MALHTMQSTWSGGTAGATIAGNVPAIQNGTDVWADYSVSNSLAGMVYASGGVGATAPGASAAGYSYYPMTGTSPNFTATLVFVNGGSGDPLVHLRRGGTFSADNDLQITFSLAANQVVVGKSIGGTVTSIATPSYTFVNGTTYTAVFSFIGTAFSLTVNGTSVYSGTVADAALQSGTSVLLALGSNATKFTSLVFDSYPLNATIAGPSGGTVSVASTNFTVTLDQNAPTGGTAVTLSDGGGGGSFAGAGVSGGVLTIAAGAATGTFTYTPASTGAKTITPTASGITFAPTTKTYTATAAGPTSGTFAGPTTGSAGVASTTFTITLGSAAPTGGSAVSLADGGVSGTFAGSGVSGGVLTIPSGSTVGTFTYTRPTAGTSVITPTLAGCTFTPTTISFVASASAATGFSLSGPSTGQVLVASTAFTYTPTGGTYTGTITPTMVGLAGTWSPTTLTWSGTASAMTATFTPSATGSGTANGTASPTLTAPSGVSYTSTAAPPPSTNVTYLSSLYGVPTGVTPTAVIKNPAGGTVTPVTGGTVVAQGSGAFSMSFTAPSGLYLVAWTASGTVVLDNAVAVGGGGGADAGAVVSTLLSTTADGSIGSVGEALKAARSAAFGKLVRSGTTLKHYAPDDTTVLKTFTLDDPLTPTSRV